MGDRQQMQSSALYDYLSWRGDLVFDNSAFCEVDSLILSIISYIDFTGFVTPDAESKKKPPVLLSATKAFLKAQKGVIPSMGLIIPKETVTLLVRAAKTARFGLMRPFAFVNRICDSEQKQFSAISFALGNGDVFVAYRGTDDTLVGWKENFNMSFMHPVPAQLEAVSYLTQVAEERREKIYVGGHSKGGNLAVYALTKCSPQIKDRVISAFNNDGPGFSREFIESEDYALTRGKIRTIIPQSSIVGMLLEHEESYEVIKSSQSGIMQHDSLSWEVLGGRFVHLDTVSDESKFIDRTIKQWLGEMSAEEREAFVDKLYEALTSTNAKTLTDLNTDKKKLRKAMGGLDAETRNTVFKYVKLILKEGAKGMVPRKEKTE